MNSTGDVRMALRVVRRFLNADDGALTVVAIVFFIMLVAVGGLAIDLGRFYGVHGQMQAYVDNIVLAGAAELDGRQDAVTRAMRAVIGDANGGPLIDGWQNFAEGATELSIERVTFLSELGPDRGPTEPTPWPGDMVLCVPWEGGAFTTGCSLDDSTRAEFVEVVATERQVNYFILPIVDLVRGLFGQVPITNSANVRLNATAGFTRELCNNMPLMLCNPSEALGSGLPFSPDPGRQMLAKTGGQGAAMFPGNFGVLSGISSGFNSVQDGVAYVNPNTSCVSREVQTQTGQGTGPITFGFNVRFDMYEGNLGQPGHISDQNLAPAANVTKGLKTTNAGNSCNTGLSNTSMPFPRDPCFMFPGEPGSGHGSLGPCIDGFTGRIGDGNWDRETYWAINHPGEPQPPGYILVGGGGMTRYQVYQYEISDAPVQTADENGAPVCNAPRFDIRDRRVLFIAVVNCVENDGLLNGTTLIPLEGIAKMFLTEPVGNTDYTPWTNTTPQDIFVEMIGKVEPNDSSGVLHIFPVLYR